MESPGRNKKHTQLSWGGFDAVSPLQSSIPPSYASMEADPLDTTQSVNTRPYFSPAIIFAKNRPGDEASRTYTS